MYTAINDVIMYLMKLSAKWMMITIQAKKNRWEAKTGKTEPQQDEWWGTGQIKQWIRIKKCKIWDREEQCDNFKQQSVYEEKSVQ